MTDDSDSMQSCTTIGCNSGVFWTTTGWSVVVKDGDPATPVEACVGTQCVTTKVSRKNGELQCTVEPTTTFPFLVCLPMDADKMQLQLQVADGDAMVSGSGANVRLTVSQLGAPKVYASTESVKATQPNGPSCGPTCRQINVTVDVSM